MPYAWVVLAAAWLGLTFLPSLFCETQISAIGLEISGTLSHTLAEQICKVFPNIKKEHSRNEHVEEEHGFGDPREIGHCERIVSPAEHIKEQKFDQGSSQCVTYRTILPWMAQETQYCSLRYILGTVYSGNTDASEISPREDDMLALSAKTPILHQNSQQERRSSAILPACGTYE